MVEKVSHSNSITFPGIEPPSGIDESSGISNYMLSAIVKQTADAVLVTDRGGVIQYVNPSFEKLTGFKKAEILGKTPSILKSGQHDKAFYSGLWSTVLSGNIFQGVLINKKKNGELYYSRKTITPLQSNGAVTHFVSTDKDITDLKIAEEQLKERAEVLNRSNQDLAQFANFIGHDLQEPVRMVVSYLELLTEKLGKLDGEAGDFLRFAVDGGRRIQLMIRNMLEYARADREVKLLPVSTAGVLEETLKNLSVSIREKKAAITQGDLPVVLGNWGQLVQLFQNLIENGLKYQDKNVPEIHIEAVSQDREWVFSVADNGIGISAGNQRRIFCLFQRLHTSAEYPGIGLGLALSEKIVLRHGGRIWVESQPGSGSTFFFTIPKISDREAK